MENILELSVDNKRDLTCYAFKISNNDMVGQTIGVKQIKNLEYVRMRYVGNSENFSRAGFSKNGQRNIYRL